MVEILQDFSPSVVAQAIDNNHIAYQSLFSTLPGAERYDEDGVSWFTTGLPYDPVMNILYLEIPMSFGVQQFPGLIDIEVACRVH